MFVTLTPHPALDRTLALAGPLAAGGVNRARTVADEPGGKGINVARALRLGGESAVAALPGDADDPVCTGLARERLPHEAVPLGGPIRTNLTLTDDDGVTTKINTSGTPVTDEVLASLLETARRVAPPGGWVALCGSLPPGAPDDWYVTATATLRAAGLHVALDTSGAALAAVAHGDGAMPHLLSPNLAELAECCGLDAGALESGGLDVVVDAARSLIRRGAEGVMVTLGSDGALLVDAEHAWHAMVEPIRVVSTVAAGDAALAGLLAGTRRGMSAPDRLALAAACGRATVALPGSRVAWAANAAGIHGATL